jgi:hypothetical protein
LSARLSQPGAQPKGERDKSLHGAVTMHDRRTNRRPLTGRALSEHEYKRRVAEGKRGKGKRQRFFGDYFYEYEVDTLIVEVERLLKPAVEADALFLEAIKIILKSDFTTPKEDKALKVRAIAGLVKNVIHLSRK